MDHLARRAAFGVLICLMCSAASVLAEGKAAPGTPAAAKAAPGSLLVHVDPKTMKLGLQAAAGTVPLELTADVLEKLNTSWEGITAESRTGGVTAYDLKGRFQPVWVVVVDGDGKAHPVCLTSLPPDVETAARAVRAKNGAGK